LGTAAIVHVAGSGPKKKEDELFKNPLGHTLFFLGDGIGFVQSVEPGLNPARYLPDTEWGLYCSEMGKPPEPWGWYEIGLYITNVPALKYVVNAVLKEGYNWSPKHDCATMVDEICRAGGVPKDKVSNTVMPLVAVGKHKAGKGLGKIKKKVRNFFGRGGVEQV
jgi:hypothetical protein